MSDSKADQAPKGIDAAAIVKESFGDKYETLNYVGRGAQAYVWKVKRVSDGMLGVAKIVIKKAEKSALEKQESAKKGEKEEVSHHSSEREFDCLKVGSHFAIVGVYDLKFMPRTETIVLEFVDSGDLMMLLRDYVKNNPGRLLSEKGIGQIFVQLAMALFHLHGCHIMHRDIKSSNILLTSTGLSKLSDFGFSRRFEDTVSNDVASTPLGTPYYIAPEIWRRRKYNSKADVFSLGIVLYELMCLRRPFAGNTLRDLMEQILRGTYEAPPDVFSSELRQVLAAMLKVNPLERPSMTEVMDSNVMKNFAKELLANVENPPANNTFAKIPAKERQQIASDIKMTMENVAKNIAKKQIPTLPAVEGGMNTPSTSTSTSTGSLSPTTSGSVTSASGGSVTPPKAPVSPAQEKETYAADHIFIEGNVNLAGDSEWKGRHLVVTATELTFKRTKTSSHKQTIPLADVQRANLATAPGSTVADDVVVLTLLQQSVSQTFFVRPAGENAKPASYWLQKICDAHNNLLKQKWGGKGEHEGEEDDFN